MSRKYPVVTDGEWVQPVRRGYRMKCCDCGLIHTINFRVKKGRVQLQPFRDQRATGAARRGKVILIGRAEAIADVKKKAKL